MPVPRHSAPAPALLALALAACGSAGQRMAVDVPAARAPSEEERVSREVGRLLSSDPGESRTAEAGLLALDDAGRRALAQHAKSIPTERDPRWLHVLEVHGLLPPLSTEEQLDLLLWKAGRPEPALVLAAQAGLLDLARRDPDRLTARLSRPGPGRDAIAVALAEAGQRRAVPALIDLYRRPSSVAERRAAAEALARLSGESRRPRVDGEEADMAKDAARLEAWWKDTQGGSDAMR